MARALINVPAKAKPGEIVEIKTLIQHPMETGFRPGLNGSVYPRDIIHKFLCSYDGELIFSADLFPAVSANPFISFTTIATKSGVLTFTWIDDQGRADVQTAKITVE